ncbi:NAD-reducing hydrogenase HoxS subunit delta [Anaerohalosphaera lusitana]|uniref:NAD-reducing hydrogenase HoxS subunit delta n=1 Tax=Anaerohalosphaera lusitana TaxID=1936003 RepID=A0A1U9NKF1_9BACT|nr:cytochrome B [Anaerohalosphaera lusitana]AQT68295.1 NAD-reducing hydrogenase HoxS subunit delta [Anaerohalosphaera lusitana]
MDKPKVAIFDFACCEGCQLQIVNLEETILDLIGAVDVVEWREAMSEKSHEYDIAIIEGSITRPEDEKRLEIIRSRAKVLIAIGACATIGGINKLKNNFDLKDVKKCVYADSADKPHVDTEMTKALDEVVEVDYKIHGCPMNNEEFAYVVRCLLMGKKPVIPDYPVCVECKAKENVCRYEYGELCLGPIIRAGCGAKCPSAGYRCFGCRGYVDNPNVDAAKEIMDKYDLTVEDLKSRMVLFGSKQGPTI